MMLALTDTYISTVDPSRTISLPDTVPVGARVAIVLPPPVETPPDADDAQFATAMLSRIAEGAPTYTHEEVRETTFEVRVPTELLAYGLQPDDIQNQVLEWLVLSLFKEERISSGKAARLLGLTRIEFLALLRRRGVAYVDYSPLELSDELAAVRSLAIEPRP